MCRRLRLFAMWLAPWAVGCVGAPGEGVDRDLDPLRDPAFEEAVAPIIAGTESTRGAVVRVYGTGLCSAVLLAPNLVMTARHCLTEVVEGAFNCDDVDGLVGAPAGTWAEAVPVGDLRVIDPGDSPFAPRVAEVLFAPGNDICASDLALLVLDRDLDDPVIAPIRLAAEPTVDEALIAVGYGVATGSTPSETLQERPVTVLAVGPDSGVGGRLDPVQAGFFAVGEGLCRGDSGGPALSASGAAVGVASTASNPDLEVVSGTAADCMGEAVRGKYQATAPHADLLRSAFARAGATPWEEGQPDPRADLGELGETCEADETCRSNVCVEGPDGERTCSQGCLEKDCPEGLACEEIGDRKRCVPEAPQEADEGCSASGRPAGTRRASEAGLALLSAAALQAWRRRRRPRGQGG